jgi:hypothetical protein
MLAEDEHSVDQFGTGLIGIAVLIFAYGIVESLRLRLLIALIGLAASLTLLNHVWRAKSESYHIRDELAKTNPIFFDRIHRIKSWRYDGWGRLFPSSNRSMACFMGGVAWIWTALITYDTIRILGYVSPEAFQVLDAILVFLSIGVALLIGIILFREKIRHETK